MKRPPVSFYITRFLCKGLFKTVVNLKVEGKENIPKDKQFILISNHLNWSDQFFLYGIFPPKPRLIFVAEYDGVYDTLSRKMFIDFHGKPIVPIHRDDPKSRIKTLKSMFKVVKRGEILAIFPEGRLGHEEGKLFPFHVGVFSVAKRLNVPILPVGISGTKELALRKPIHIRIGELSYSSPEESDEDYARRMALKVKELIPSYPGDGPFPNTWNWLTWLYQGELRPFEGEKDLIIPTQKEKRKKA